MKIAVSGAHRTGKTTLIGELAASLPGYRVVDEPYHLLEEDGYRFPEMPSVDDFEAQLERSIESIARSEGDCLFDRCPADFIAYLIARGESEGFDAERRWIEARDAMKRIDLVVFVPIEDPDRVPVSVADRRRLRRRVDEELRDMIMDDSWSFGVPALEVEGSPDDRARRVLTRIGRK